MQKPKVVVIGAGSLFFGRQAIWQMTTSPHLNGGTLALVDTDPVVLARMKTLAEKAVAHAGAKLAVVASTDAREVLPESDFVVLSFADRSVRFRGIDCRISLKYGVRMCSGDTIGPGGIMRTLREFPRILSYARDIQELCPEAWVINYINPTAANGLGLRKHAPQVKSFALCDGLHMPHVKRNYALRARIVENAEQYTPEVEAKFDFRITGVNHFTWLLKAEYEGTDVSVEIAEALREQAATETDGMDKGAKARFNATISYELYKAFGKVPTCTGHTKEYVRFWQGLGVTEETIPPLSTWDPAERYPRHDAMFREVDGYNLGVHPMSQFFERTKADHATDIIENMWAGLGKPFFINTANNGAVRNMPDDAFLEMMCDSDMKAVTPRPIGDAPVGLRGLWQQVLDTHELSALAAVSGDREVLYRAFLCDPMISSLADSRKMIDELLEAERDALPEYWFTPASVPGVNLKKPVAASMD